MVNKVMALFIGMTFVMALLVPMAEAVKLFGKVVDDSTIPQPQDGARVFVKEQGVPGPGSRDLSGEAEQGEGPGEYSISGLNALRFHDIVARKPKFKPAAMTLFLPDALEVEQDLQLRAR